MGKSSRGRGRKSKGSKHKSKHNTNRQRSLMGRAARRATRRDICRPGRLARRRIANDE